ncbi:hypothetical protein EVAR_37893_1 [Eumeta japonica]|uniref:Uncharacterized protein n=1 Tax=Eumeta variegata TaxID=151549 RepID=A0A4C1Y6R7_EUMVA|nr:hypothetical protein EVAR_37893_1 [Eumeta japonica]
MCIRPVKTYASTVFAYAAPNALHDLKRNLELPTIPKHMKDASKRFFAAAENHPNFLLFSAVAYEALLSYPFLRRPRIALTDPVEELTAAAEGLIEVNDIIEE